MAHEPEGIAADVAVRIHFDAGAGLSNHGIDAGALALVQAWIFEIGPVANFSGGFRTSKAGLGLAAGAGARVTPGLRLDVLAELGRNRHHVSHGAFLSDDPGGAGQIPYAGVRAGARWVPGRADAVVGFSLGIWVYAQTDLATKHVSYDYFASSEVGFRARRRRNPAR